MSSEMRDFKDYDRWTVHTKVFSDKERNFVYLQKKSNLSKIISIKIFSTTILGDFILPQILSN